MYAHYYDFLQFSKTKGLAGAEGPCRRSAGAAFLLEDLDPECKAKMMKVIVVNNFLTKLHTVQKTHVIAVFLLAGSAALPEVWVNFFLARARGAGRP